MHACMSAKDDTFLKQLSSEPPRPVHEKNLKTATHVVIYMSKPTVEGKDFLRQKALEDDFYFQRIGRTESRKGSCDSIFSVATMLTLPLSAALVESYICYG